MLISNPVSRDMNLALIWCVGGSARAIAMVCDWRHTRRHSWFNNCSTIIMLDAGLRITPKGFSSGVESHLSGVGSHLCGPRVACWTHLGGEVHCGVAELCVRTSRLKRWCKIPDEGLGNAQSKSLSAFMGH